MLTLSITYLEIFDDNVFKVIYAFLIAYYACFDPVYSIALTTLMIIAIQELHRRNATHDISLSNLDGNSSINNSSTHGYDNDSKTKHYNLHNKKINIKHCDNLLDNDEYIYNEINKHALQKTPSSNDDISAEYDFDPAFETITNNIKQKQNSLGTNIIQGVDQQHSIQPFTGNIYNVQGLPNGFDSTKYNTEIV